MLAVKLPLPTSEGRQAESAREEEPGWMRLNLQVGRPLESRRPFRFSSIRRVFSCGGRL
jgi:hypothetical protein